MSDFITYKNGHIFEVRCKNCMTIIQQMKPILSGMTSRKANDGTVIQTMPVSIGNNANYTEINLIGATPDGKSSKHTTHLCSTCASSVLTLDQLNIFYQEDLDELEESNPNLNPDNLALWRSVVISSMELVRRQ